MTDSTIALPFARSYWAAPNRLLAGCYPGDSDPAQARNKLEALIRHKVGLVVNLMHTDEVNWKGEPFVDYCPVLAETAHQHHWSIRCERLPIRDNDVPTVTHMRRILDTIDESRVGEVAYVHCWGGKGRTGTVVGCYLARHGMAVGDAALRRLKELAKASAYDFGPIPQTSAQCDFVRKWVQGQ